MNEQNVKATGLQITLADGQVLSFYPLVLVFDNQVTGKRESLECYSDHFTWNEYSCTDEEALVFIHRMAKHYEDITTNETIKVSDG